MIAVCSQGSLDTRGSHVGVPRCVLGNEGCPRDARGVAIKKPRLSPADVIGNTKDHGRHGSPFGARRTGSTLTQRSLAITNSEIGVALVAPTWRSIGRACCGGRDR